MEVQRQNCKHGLTLQLPTQAISLQSAPAYRRIYVMLSCSQPTNITLARLCWTMCSQILKLNYPNPQRWPSPHVLRESLSYRISYVNFMWLMWWQHDVIHKWWKLPGRKHLTWGIPKRSDKYGDSELWDTNNDSLQKHCIFFFYLICTDASYTTITNFSAYGVLDSQHLVVICLTVRYLWLSSV